MLRIISATSCLLVVLTATMLQAGDAMDGFITKVYKGPDGESKYVVYVPKSYKGDKEFPLILFLHGSGEAGTDGEKQVKVGLGPAIKKMESFPFIAVFPQSPEPGAKGWLADRKGAKAAMSILAEVEKTYKVDSKRIYLTGLSMGGYGTWSLAAAYPDRWAAIVPICGGGNLADAEKIKAIPCWCFHGDADPAVKVQRSREMMEALKKAGAMPKYTEFEKVGHDSWVPAYATAELYEWLSKQKAK